MSQGGGLASNKPFKGWIAINKSTGQIAVAEAPPNGKHKENTKNEIQNVHKAISDEDLLSGVSPTLRNFITKSLRETAPWALSALLSSNPSVGTV